MQGFKLISIWVLEAYLKSQTLQTKATPKFTVLRLLIPSKQVCSNKPTILKPSSIKSDVIISSYLKFVNIMNKIRLQETDKNSKYKKNNKELA